MNSNRFALITNALLHTVSSVVIASRLRLRVQ